MLQWCPITSNFVKILINDLQTPTKSQKLNGPQIPTEVRRGGAQLIKSKNPNSIAHCWSDLKPNTQKNRWSHCWPIKIKTRTPKPAVGQTWNQISKKNRCSHCWLISNHRSRPSQSPLNTVKKPIPARSKAQETQSRIQFPQKRTPTKANTDKSQNPQKPKPTEVKTHRSKFKKPKKSQNHEKHSKKELPQAHTKQRQILEKLSVFIARKLNTVLFRKEQFFCERILVAPHVADVQLRKEEQRSVTQRSLTRRSQARWIIVAPFVSLRKRITAFRGRAKDRSNGTRASLRKDCRPQPRSKGCWHRPTIWCQPLTSKARETSANPLVDWRRVSKEYHLHARFQSTGFFLFEPCDPSLFCDVVNEKRQKECYLQATTRKVIAEKHGTPITARRCLRNENRWDQDLNGWLDGKATKRQTNTNTSHFVSVYWRVFRDNKWMLED